MEPTFFLNELFHSERAKPGGRNYGYFRNEEYDSVVEKQLTEMDPIKRKALVFKAQELIHKTMHFSRFAIGIISRFMTKNELLTLCR